MAIDNGTKHDLTPGPIPKYTKPDPHMDSDPPTPKAYTPYETPGPACYQPPDQEWDSTYPDSDN